MSYAELHCHTSFSFLDGASAADELVERAVELGLAGLAVTDHGGLYGVVRFVEAAQAAGIHPVVGLEIELLDPAVPDPSGVVVPRRRTVRRGRSPEASVSAGPADVRPHEGLPDRPRPARARLPGHREPVREDLRGIGEAQRGPHLVLLARDATGYRSLCRLVSRANLAGTKGLPRFTQALLADHAEGLIALSGCREGEVARRLRVGDRDGARGVAERYATMFGARAARSGAARRGGAAGRGGAAAAGFLLELGHHLLPDDEWLVAETARLAAELGLPVVTTNDVHYARPEDRELHDVLTAIRHGRTLDTLGDLRRPDGESHLKGERELLALPPGEPGFAAAEPLAARAWAEGIANAAEVAAACTVDLGFERYRFPGFPVPRGETAFSYLEGLCHEGARRRYHPMTPAVVRQLAHELEVIERTGLAEFFLICWDLMRFAKARGIPAQGRGSAADSIVAYVLGITRVDPIRHNLLFERFINEGRTTYPDVDIDFSSERREEVIQYVYDRYGPEHTGMVCNVVTYRARSAVREVGYALGFPRPLVDRVAKALETYDSVMVRRDLEADGGFAEFFRRPGEAGRGGVAGASRTAAADAVATSAALAGERGLVDRMGQLDHARGGRIRTGGAGERGDGRLPRREDAARAGSTGPTSGAAGVTSGAAGVVTPSLAGGHRTRSGGPEGEVAPPGGTFGVVGAGSDAWTEPATSDPGSGAAGSPRMGGADDPAPPPSGPESRAAGDAAGAAGDAAGAAGDAAGAAGVVTPFLAGRQRGLNGGIGGEVTSLVGTAGVADAGFRAWIGQKAEHAMPDPGIGAAGNTPISNGVHIAAGGPGGAGGPGAAGAAGGPGAAGAAGGPGAIPGATGAAGDAANDTEPPVDPGNGTWSAAPGSAPAIRPGRHGGDEGGPGDSPASVAWLRAGRGTGYDMPGTVDGRRIDPESGALLPPERRTDRLGRPYHWDPPAPSAATMGRGGDRLGRPDPHSSVARVVPDPPSQPRGGSTVGMSDWERWLELCARIDGFPRHLSIHSGGMLVTAAPLIDIAPLERATMPGRVVVQYDKRDVETLKLIKLDLLGLGMLAAIDETLQRIEHDCATCIDLDRIPEEIPEVFAMLQAADTVGVFQVESRAQMQTLPKSRPASLDDLVVEVAIIRPGPIQGNAVHPYLRRKQGLEPVTYLHPSLEPILGETLGVILYQEQVMKVAIEVAGFSPAESDGFRRAMGTWRSTREMEKLHARFIDGCLRQPGMDEPTAEELFRRVAAFASFGFAKSHAAAFARTAYESSFLKLFYPAQFLAGLVNAQPMGFYPVEVLVNDAKRHGVAVLPVDVNASSYETTTEWVGRPGWTLAGAAGDDGSHDGDPGEPLPDDAGIEARPQPVRSPACVIPTAAARERWAAESAMGWGVRLGLGLVKGIGEEHRAWLDAELARGPYTSLVDVVERTELGEEVVERLIRTGALDSLGRPRRELLWQLREVAGASRGRLDGRRLRTTARIARRAAGRPMDLRLPATEVPPLPQISESERLGDAYAVIGLDARRQVVGLFREALDRLGAVPASALAARPPGPVRLGGLVVTRQHPMTARGTVFLALEDETGMVNVTLWPDAWGRLRNVVRRHALLLVDGTLQREGEVVNVIASDVRPLSDAAAASGGPDRPPGVRQLGYAGMRRVG